MSSTTTITASDRRNKGMVIVLTGAPNRCSYAGWIESADENVVTLVKRRGADTISIRTSAIVAVTPIPEGSLK